MLSIRIVAICALLTSFLVAASPAPAPHASTLERARNCGTTTTEDVRLKVRVERGHVRCKTARHILRQLFSGGGDFRPGPSNAESYTQVGKWRCGVSTGIGSCIRFGKRFETARDWITGDAR